MFNNANVIFRTKFVDGVSQVTRTIGTGSSRPFSGKESGSMNVSHDNNKAAKKSQTKGKENIKG
jgi:structural maintenance of chromosome 2